MPNFLDVLNMKKDGARVLVVGAGPSGLMSALVLARSGVPVRIIEKDLQKSPYSRAIAVQIRSLEIFDALGLLDALKEKSNAVEHFVITTESRIPIAINPELVGSRFSSPLIVDQPHTEAVLEAALNEFGIEVERGLTLEKILAHDKEIYATVKDTQGHLEERNYSYVIGADGAHSTVRKQMLNSFLGESYEDAFILADVIVEKSIDKKTIQLFFKGPNFLALIPMYGHNHYRLISVRHNERTKTGPAPTKDEFQKLLDALCTFPVSIINAMWVSRFFVQCRSALHYQEGAIFLVGDAAHIHSPAGGQGMNTGLQDAFNLAVKLAMVWRKEAAASLLETYQEERKPVGEFLLKYTDRIFRFMVRGSFWARLLRTVFLPRLLRSKERQAKFFRIGSQTAVRYRKGFLCAKNHVPDLPHIAIGLRVPDFILINSHVQRTTLHAMALENAMNIFVFISADMPTAMAKKFIKSAYEIEKDLFVKIHVVFANDFDAERIIVEEEYSILSSTKAIRLPDEAFYLAVRADHHVFCYGYLDNLIHLREELEKFIARKKL